jgi:hypothetical protein
MFFAAATKSSLEQDLKELFNLQDKGKKAIGPQMQTAWEDWYKSKLDKKWERERLDLDYLG